MQTLDREWWRIVSPYLDRALEMSHEDRPAWLASVRQQNPAVADQLETLLEEHGALAAGAFLEQPPEMLPAAGGGQHFSGTERFRVVRRLGTGGMGVVYEVHDRVRDEVVALKTLLGTGAADLYRLKREFRTLADVTHPNLVCLYELFVEDARCFFTMELVDGVSFVDYARPANRARLSEERLVPAFRQLVDGVSALHRQGKLHRDIKPSNVLVTPEGRVVILDFGLIAELAPQHPADATRVRGGTPAYMAPEEASGATASEAGDWYGVGVTLYQALTGTIPFAGSIHDLLLRKKTSDPPPPEEVEPGVSTDLSAACMGLLCRNPEQRLSGLEALEAIARDAARRPRGAVPAPIGDTPFVGRDRELRVLHDAFRTVLGGSAAAAAIHGPSGIGKSALVRSFLGRIREANDVVVLYGRCYENESVPYKALDGVIDDLSRYLGSIPRHHVESLMPDHVPALTRVFPVLLQVEAIAHARLGQVLRSADPLDLRRRAFAALRELLRRLAHLERLVISIDDLQWADADSAVLLEELLRPPRQPPMLTLLSFRSEETAAKPFLQALLARAGRDMWSAISLEPMTEEEARSLIGALLPADSALTDPDRCGMTREAGGSPFVLEQLARYAVVNRMAPGQAPTFAEMFDTRLGALSPDARRFLETLAICGRPMASELICEACGVTRERQSVVTMLRSSRFIRSSGSSERIETYHDRIREVVAGQMTADAVRRAHGLMVDVLVERRSDDCEALFEHYLGAGASGNAATQAGLAAAKAGTALAFDRAAAFYRHALTLSPASTAAPAWREGLAHALANAGRPAEAADAYLRAAAGAGHPQEVELQRRGAEQFLIGGHIDSGLDLIRTMLAGMGVGVPRTPRGALLSMLWRRAKLRWRGLGFVSRAADDIDPDTLLRVDTCWSATTGLLLVDLISAADFSSRHLLMALDAGEPYRLARAMAIESVSRIAYPASRPLGLKLIEQSRVLAKEVGEPHAIALSILADGMMATALGEWKKALTLSEQGLAILRDQCVGATWELNIAQNLVIWALMYLGEIGEVSRRVPALLASARSSGNLYIATELCTRSNYAWLVADDPDEGERETVESIERWSQKGFHRQHYSARLARVQTALYRGDADAAWRLFTEEQSMVRRSLLTRVQVLRIESHYLQARCALAMAEKHGHHRRFLSMARAGARRIAAERMPWSDPIGLLVRAGIAHVEGSTSVAVRYLHEAAGRFDGADMKLYAAVARRRIGGLQDDEQGRALGKQADDWMAAQSIRNPAAMTRMLAPGFANLP